MWTAAALLFSAGALGMAGKTGLAVIRWSSERRALFLATLSLTSNVAASERAADMPRGSAYKLRARDAGFREEWRLALAEGYAQLETRLLERAIKGQRKAIRRNGEIVGWETEFSERLQLALLTAHRASVRGPSGEATDPTEIRVRIEAKLAAALKVRGDD